MELRDYFTGVAWKRLTDVEADAGKSNQHELNGVAALRTILGEPQGTVRFKTRFQFIPDDAEDALSTNGVVSWYDSRENQEHRSAEYRLYYPGNEVSEAMRPGDLVVIARRGELLHWLVAPAGSTAESQLTWLFSLEERDSDGQRRLHAKPVEPLGSRSWFSVRRAMEALEIEPVQPTEDSGEAIVLNETVLPLVYSPTAWDGLPLDAWVAEGLPSTAEFSRITRGTIEDFEGMAKLEPDAALTCAMQREEEIFVEWERRLLEGRVREGFESVDSFLTFSMSIQNRRKSRAGHAFEHHIAAVLIAQGLRFERNVRTENNARPDFMMPGAAAYSDPAFPSGDLDMLGAKTTCKDRWRQVLTEAQRIDQKHLVTLEPAISDAQTDEMRSHGLQLVLPEELRGSYKAGQRQWLMSVEAFCEMRRGKDRSDPGGLFP